MAGKLVVIVSPTGYAMSRDRENPFSRRENMSWNHENVAWQSKDKTWNIGFFPANAPHGSEEDGYDPEWDVDYDYDRFENVFTGHKTSEEARIAASKMYGNYGGSQIIPWGKEDAEYVAKYEEMALWHTNPKQAELNLKKKEAKLKREHTAKLKEQFAEKNDFKGLYVTVTMKVDDKTYTRMGVSQSYTGYATVVGDWLMVDKAQVKNMKTGRLNRKLYDVRVDRAPSSYGYGYGRW
jgi:hypothetical protein